MCLTSFEVNWNPLLGFDPALLESLVAADWNIHLVATRDYLHTTVSRVGWVNCNSNRQVLKVTKSSISSTIDVGCKSTRTSKLVVH
ncbi:hypothetical protein OCU04_003443 [Sclerotinia nivalis]|uniref:Uncharacterized protein n=1 Tax=Sclerotinia nivalis TaxID=352851 RepID=A0A9X0ARX7_9HELO|nr:hypothetical protein OCU04_003443 [Sclerotinia nivalis]